MSREAERQYWIEFLQLYQSKPAVWKLGSEIYKNRRLKKEAYEELAEKMREIDPKATTDSVKKKINSLRACYRRELGKMRQSAKAGQEYDGSKWVYYDYLSFLDDYKDDPLDDEAWSLGETQDAEYVEEEQIPKSKVLKSKTRIKRCISPSLSSSSEHSEAEVQIPKSINVKSKTSIKRCISPSSSVDHIEEEIERHQKSANIKLKTSIKRCSPSSVEHSDRNEVPRKLTKYDNDEADILGMCWAFQYRDLTREQKIFAKKAIDDVLFEGTLKTLNRHSVKINETLCSNCCDQSLIEVNEES